MSRNRIKFDDAVQELSSTRECISQPNEARCKVTFEHT